MFKKIGKILLLIMIFVGGFAVGLGTKFYIDEWRAARNVTLWMESFEAPYKNDKYGGATPEETFDLYLSALKKGDLELASKYFWVDKQRGELEDLREMKSEELNSYIQKIEKMPSVWKVETSDNKDVVKFLYIEKVEQDTVADLLGKKVVVPAGDYGRTIKFTKLNNIWKIYSL